MEKIFIVLLMTVWSNGEPEIIQYGTSVLGESFASRKECEDRLTDLAVEPDLTKEKNTQLVASVPQVMPDQPVG